MDTTNVQATTMETRSGQPGLRLWAALILAAALVAVPASANASEIGGSKKLGIGIVLGYPGAGLSINYFLSRSTSLQIDPMLHFRNDYEKDNDHGAIGGRLDLLYWMPSLAAWSAANLVWYWGPGVNVGLGLGDNRQLGVGVEFPIGIGLRFHKAPIDLNLEAVPTLYVTHDIYLGIGGALTARYYF